VTGRKRVCGWWCQRRVQTGGTCCRAEHGCPCLSGVVRETAERVCVCGRATELCLASDSWERRSNCDFCDERHLLSSTFGQPSPLAKPPLHPSHPATVVIQDSFQYPHSTRAVAKHPSQLPSPLLITQPHSPAMMRQLGMMMGAQAAQQLAGSAGATRQLATAAAVGAGQKVCRWPRPQACCQPMHLQPCQPPKGTPFTLSHAAGRVGGPRQDGQPHGAAPAGRRARGRRVRQQQGRVALDPTPAQ
jgi:hypothetical protein